MMVMIGSGGGVRTIINYVRSTTSYDETRIETRNRFATHFDEKCEKRWHVMTR